MNLNPSPPLEGVQDGGVDGRAAGGGGRAAGGADPPPPRALLPAADHRAAPGERQPDPALLPLEGLGDGCHRGRRQLQNPPCLPAARCQLAVQTGLRGGFWLFNYSFHAHLGGV